MALAELLQNGNNKTKIGVSEERVRKILPFARQYVSFFRDYPDIFVDFMQTGFDEEKEKELTFHLYFYQRCFLRAAMRHKYVYAVFPRA